MTSIFYLTWNNQDIIQCFRLINIQFNINLLLLDWLHDEALGERVIFKFRWYKNKYLRWVRFLMHFPTSQVFLIWTTYVLKYVYWANWKREYAFLHFLVSFRHTMTFVEILIEYFIIFIKLSSLVFLCFRITHMPPQVGAVLVLPALRHPLRQATCKCDIQNIYWAHWFNIILSLLNSVYIPYLHLFW